MSKILSKKVLGYVVLAVITAGLIAVLLQVISLQEFLTALTRLTLWQIPLLILGFLGISVIAIFMKQFVLVALDNRVPYKPLTLVHFASIAAHYSTPVKLGLPVTVYLLKQMEDVPYAKSSIMIVLEIFTTTMITGAIALLGAALYFRERLGLILLALAGVAVIGVGLYLALNYHKKKSDEEKTGKIRTYFNNLMRGFRELDLSAIAGYAGLTMVKQIASAAYLIGLLWCFSAHISLVEALVAGSTAFFLGTISMVPLGLGVREASMLFYLNLFGIPMETAVAAVAVQRVINTGFAYLLGIIAANLVGARFIQKNKPSPVGTKS